MMKLIEGDLSKLAVQLEATGKHGRYQALPPELLAANPSLRPFSHSRRLDEARYDWMTRHLDFEGRRVVEIGANIGYFALRLASQHEACVTAYEPFGPHLDVLEKLKQIAGLTDNQLVCRGEGVALDDVPSLAHSDIMILFNVLQHAGEDFDRAQVSDITLWRSYAVRYLRALRSRTDSLVFQTGYTWLGHAGELCAVSEIVPFTINLLEESGWSPAFLGLVTDPNRPVYRDVPIDWSNGHPLDSISVRIVSRVRSLLRVPSIDVRFAQRPLIICR